MIKIEFRGVEEAIAHLGRISQQVKVSVVATMRRLQYEAVNSARQAFDEVLHSRTGAGKGSIQPGEFRESDTEVEAEVVAGGGEQFYLRAHEYGPTDIEAKNVANLTIPLDPAMTAMGVGRFAARQVIEDPASYGYTGTFFKRGILFGKSEDGGIKALFLLRPSVTLPARPFMSVGFKRMVPVMLADLSEAVGEAVQ